MTDKKSYSKLTVTDFEKSFAEKLSPYVRNKIRKYNFQYRQPTQQERDGFIKKNLEALLNKPIEQAGSRRKQRWEKGWSENLSKYNKAAVTDSLIPKYFGKHNCIRWKQDFIIPLSKNFEANSLFLIQDWLFDKYLRKVKSVYEFGCGTGHNLLRLRSLNKNAILWGLDWTKSSQELIAKIRETGLDHNIYSRNFDFFKPDYSFKLDKNGVAITIASLEQTGDKFDKFINYLVETKPKLCIHIEPVYELLDKNSLLDLLSVKYFQKRKYLWGLLSYLRKLETLKKIKIIRAQRTFVGSLFIDGYSVIVWQPI